MWAQWWVWIVFGFGLGVLEILAPGYIFLGFAIGAVAVGIFLALGIAVPGLPALAVIFAVASLVAWVALRRLIGVRDGQAKIWDRDINDN